MINPYRIIRTDVVLAKVFAPSVPTRQSFRVWQNKDRNVFQTSFLLSGANGLQQLLQKSIFLQKSILDVKQYWNSNMSFHRQIFRRRSFCLWSILPGCFAHYEFHIIVLSNVIFCAVVLSTAIISEVILSNVIFFYCHFV